jgi:hypothetical protein
MAQDGTRLSGAKKAELRITENVGGIPIKATCSSCPSVVFSTSPFLGSKADNQAALDLLFAAHFSQVHRHEENSQAAARIVREATE